MMELMTIGSLGTEITLKDSTVRKQIDGYKVIDKFLNTLNSIHTKKAYLRSIMEFFTFMYSEEKLTLDMMVIDPSQARRYTEYWKGQLDEGKIKSTTYNSKIKGIKQFYDWLSVETSSNVYDYRIFTINPFNNCKQVAENDSDGSMPLTPDEVIKMLNNPYGSTPHIRERNTLMFIFAIITGIRNTALITITEDNIQKIDEDYVLIAEDKERKTARMSITLYYERLMSWYRVDKTLRGKDDSGTIFNITPISANRIIKAWAERVGLEYKKITFHSLRTTTAVQIFHNTNQNVYEVQQALNHSHIETTNVYLKKENAVNHSGEFIIENIITTETSFEEELEKLSKEEIIKILSSLPLNEKSKILRLIK